jgi:hypothetical protein
VTTPLGTTAPDVVATLASATVSSEDVAPLDPATAKTSSDTDITAATGMREARTDMIPPDALFSPPRTQRDLNCGSQPVA